MVEQRPVRPHLAGPRGVAEAALEEGPLTGVEAEPGCHFRCLPKHAFENTVVKRAGGRGLGAWRHTGAAGKSDRSASGRPQQELAAVDREGHACFPSHGTALSHNGGSRRGKCRIEAYSVRWAAIGGTSLKKNGPPIPQ